MLDGLFKSKIDRFWDRLAKGLARTGLTPNMITLLGFILSLIFCLYFYVYENYAGFGILLVLTFACDSLDGAVARMTDTATKYGSYLDAVVDRYQEVVIYFVIGAVTEFWILVFWVITGSLLISYNKARVAIDTPISNTDWPDLLERLERVIILCLALILEGVFPGKNILYYMLILMGVLTHFTAVQRFLRAKKLLNKMDKVN